MKKSIFTKLTSLTVTAAIVMSFTSFIHADVTEDAGDPQEMISEDITVEEFAVPETDFDNDELAAKYIMNKMSGGSEATYRKYDLSGYLEQYDKTIFNYIVPVISDIASGNQTSAVITVPEDTLLISFSNTDLGVEDFSALSVDEAKALVSQNMPVHSSKIMNALLFASPYNLYWFDKTTGMGMTYSFSRSRTTLKLYNFTFYFYVASEYQGRNNLEVSSDYGEAVSAAASNANTIIENNAGLDDYSKLLAYNNEICKLTDYNYSAAGGGVAYGNPWQLVWVFDGDPDTKVVCEGYSKAFQYLCDNSVFRCSDLYTISVSGYLAGEGHMWNIVHMDDEKNYVVDITNSDPGGEGNYGSRLFLIGAVSGSVSSGYTLKNGYLYTYKTSTMNSYSEDVITVSSADYNPNAEYSLTLEGEVDSSSLSKSKAKAGEEISVSYTLPVGKELESILVNGKAIDGTTFTMPAMDTTVVVTFKKADYKITVSDTTGGTAYTDKSVANYKDLITVTATPDTGYKLDAIKVDGITINGNSFEMPAADVTVEVTFVKIDYAVTVNCTTGGTASAPDTANYGDEITVSVTPDTGYELDTIKVNDAAIGGNSFTMPASDVTIEVTFKKISYTISITNTSGGSANVDKTTAYYGEEIEIDIAIEESYHLDSILVNGTAIDGDKFNMPAGNVTIEVIFKKNEYTIMVSDVTGGTAAVSAETAAEGEEITITATPDKGYALDKIKVNGTAITGKKFTMPAANVTVEVTFKKVVYKISLNSSGNGTVNLSKTKANYGDEITVEITPASGYELSKITVKTADGSKVNVTDNTFVMPDANVTVSVTFAKISYGITVEDNGLGTVDVVSSAIKGNHIIVDISPAEGCELESLTAVDSEGNDIEVTDNSFTMPGASVTITAVFRKIDYTITIVCSDHGTATVSGNPANFGDEITVTALPDNGFELNTIKVDDEIIEGNTFTMPAKDITITVTFRDRTYSLNGWILEDGKYYFYENGKMVKGWIKSGSSWYYMDTETGAMVTGWKNAGGKWYYFTGSGAMVTGWQKIGGTWYFFESSGAMATGWKESGGKWYYFTGSGAMVTGWQKIGGTWYYFESSGAMATGWKNSGGKWYYFTSSGAMQTGWKQSGSDWYYLDTSSGAMVTGWKSISGKWYYFYDSGVMAYSTTIDGYTLGADGAMI